MMDWRVAAKENRAAGVASCRGAGREALAMMAKARLTMIHVRWRNMCRPGGLV